MTDPALTHDLLARIAAALERLAPPPFTANLGAAAAFRWIPARAALDPAPVYAGAPLDLLLGMDRQKQALLENTRRFAAGGPANNALLWGSRGTGKSALIKAVVAAAQGENPNLKMVEAPPSELERVGALIDALRAQDHPVVLFLDDLSFAGDETALKALKPALDGGLNAQGGRVVVYATSNRRHLVARDARENTPGDILWADAAEEHLALADRFGLWLGFHAMDQDVYLAVVAAYAEWLGLGIDPDDLRREALLWSRTRGARSGRTAFQFILDAAGRAGKPVKF